MTHSINGNLATSISEVKKGPMKFFTDAKASKKAIYVFNNNKPVGVLLDNEQFDSMQKTIEWLQDKLIEMEVATRIRLHESDKNSKTYTLEEVLGHDLSDVSHDEYDGWE